jgi:HSP20 family protein
MVSKQEDSKTDNKRNYIRREFSYQRINQSYILPDDADHKNIKAKVENGVLTINIPKVPAESQAKAVKNIAIE